MKRFFPIALALLLSGCGGGILAPSGPAPKLYTLSAPETVPTTVQPVAWQLVLAQPYARLDLNSPRIAIIPAPGRMDYYADVTWTDRAPALVQGLLLASFERSGRIQAVGRRGGDFRGDYLLDADLEDFEIDATASPPVAHVRLTARLVRERDQQIVASRTFDQTAPTGETFDGAAAAFDTALASLLPQIVDWTLVQGNRAP